MALKISKLSIFTDAKKFGQLGLLTIIMEQKLSTTKL